MSMAAEFERNELRSVMLGDLIGKGSARKTYVCLLNASYVVKIEENARSFQNVAEWDVWSWVNNTPFTKWFAPCAFIANAGSVLIQRRVEPIRRAELPRLVPMFFADLKLDNFGMLEGRVVCCDYGTVGSVIRHVPKRLIRATWK